MFAQIHKLEQLATKAWPPAEVAPLDGWWLRYSAGVTRRANSVWPNVSLAELPIDEKLARVESFYAARQLPARFQMSPAAEPSDLDERLAARGYHRVAPSAVQVSELSTVLQKTDPLRLHPEFVVEVAEELFDEWFQLYASVEHAADSQVEGRRAIIERIASPVGFALLQIDGEPAAVGLGVVDEAWLGIFCMATAPRFRRRGAASAILRTLTIWAQLYEADHAYLQVMEGNGAAQALYARAGFVTLYRYYYREQGAGSRE